MKRLLFVVAMSVAVFIVMSVAVAFNKQQFKNKNNVVLTISHKEKSVNRTINALVDNGPTQ